MFDNVSHSSKRHRTVLMRYYGRSHLDEDTLHRRKVGTRSCRYRSVLRHGEIGTDDLGRTSPTTPTFLTPILPPCADFGSTCLTIHLLFHLVFTTVSRSPHHLLPHTSHSPLQKNPALTGLCRGEAPKTLLLPALRLPSLSSFEHASVLSSRLLSRLLSP